MRWFWLVMIVGCAPVEPSFRLAAGSQPPSAELIPLSGDVYLTRAWHHDEAGVASKNGLLVASGGRAVMIDTPESARAAAQIAERARAHSLDVEARLVTDADASGRLQLAGSELEYFATGLGGFVVYVPSQGVLYAGDLVRARDAALGPLPESQLVPWHAALVRIGERFPDAHRVVPSQGDPGGRELFAHTRAMLNARIGEVSGFPGGG